MLKRAVMLIQADLKKKGHYQRGIDGNAGKATMQACEKYLNMNFALLPQGAMALPESRKLNFTLQLLCKEAGIDSDPVDGFWGPVTQHAFESLAELRSTGHTPPNFRDDEPLESNPHLWPRDTANQSAMHAFYGPPGSPPLKQVRCPWALRLAWDKSQIVRNVGVHAKVADSMENIFARVHQHYGEAELKRLRLDLFGGSFANRKKRGGSTWSTHAWAVALDWDPERNQLKWGRDRASLDDPAYAFWWRAWEEEGWVSLGRSRNFDWMHVQAARL